MNDSLDDVLQRYFDDVARHDHLGDTPVRVVMRRGRRRRARRRTGAMAGTLVVGALGSVVAARTMSSGDGERRVSVGTDGSDGSTEHTPSPVPTVGAPNMVASPLVWNSMQVGSAEALINGGSFLQDPASGAYYAVSTEPGRSNSPQAALYRSNDGLHWRTTGEPPQLTNRSELAVGAGRLYALGTQAADAATSSGGTWEATLASSADDGASWSEQPLPFDLDAIRALPFVKNIIARSSVAGTAAATVVATVTNASIDPAQVAPPGVPADALGLSLQLGGLVEYEVVSDHCPELTSETATTVFAGTAPETTSVPSCVAWQSPLRAYTWSELGVPEDVAAEAQGMLRLAVSTDGASFTEIASPPMLPGWALERANVQAIGDELLLTANLARVSDPVNQENPGYEQQSLAFTSRDGIAWAPLSLPVSWVERVGRLGNGSLAVIGSTEDSSLIAVQLADGTWHTTPFDARLVGGDNTATMVLPVSNPAIGSLGIAALVQIEQRPPDDVGVSVSTTVVDVADTAGAPTAPPTVAAPATTREQASHGFRLLFSRDGVNWSVEDIEQLSERGFVSGGASLVGDQVVLDLSVSAVSDDPDAALTDRTLLVGTLAG